MSPVAARLPEGLADPVHDAQATFAAVMDAMARPGRVMAVTAPLDPPDGIGRAATLVLLTLADADTPIWLAQEDPDLAGWLRSHTGAAVVSDPAAAVFAYATVGRVPDLPVLAQGTQDYPDRSATLIAGVGWLAAEGGFRLTGPGIETEHRLDAGPLPAGFADRWSANRARFPRGVDMILCATGTVACLPRTVRIQEG